MNEKDQSRLGGALCAARTLVRARRVALPALGADVVFGFISISYPGGHSHEWSAFAQESRHRSASDAAIEQFWAIYHGNDYAAIPQVQNQLEAAIQLDPNNPALYALLGATHFWHVGESTRDPNQ